MNLSLPSGLCLAWHGVALAVRPRGVDVVGFPLRLFPFVFWCWTATQQASPFETAVREGRSGRVGGDDVLPCASLAQIMYSPAAEDLTPSDGE